MKQKAYVISGNYAEEIAKKLTEYKYEKYTAETYLDLPDEENLPQVFIIEPERGKMHATLCVIDSARKAMERRKSGTIVFLVADSDTEDMQTVAESFFWQGFAKSLACELAEFNIRVNSIVIPEKECKKAVAETIRFLSGEDAYITAQALHINEKKKWVNQEAQQRKVIVITGAGQGIGRAIAETLQEDHIVCINDLHCTDSMERMEQQGKAELLVADISDKEAIEEQLQNVVKKYGRIDVLIANAAYMQLEPFTKEAIEVVEKHFDINVMGHMNCLETVIPIMKKQGHGILLFFSSMFGILGWKNGTGYASTKTAMIGLTQYCHKKYAESGISAVAVAPGVVNTPQLQADADDMGVSIEKMREIYAEETPLKRIGEPEELASMVKFLVDYGAEYMSGRTIQSNGGECRCTPES